MSDEALSKLGAEIGVSPDGEEKKKREVKHKNVKDMSKKELQGELPKKRKAVTALEKEIAELRGKVEGPGSALSLPPEMWGAIPGILYEFLAVRFGDHWRLSAQELPIVGVHFEKVLNRYLPGMSTAHPELMGFGLIVVGLSIPRAMTTIQKRIDEQAKKVSAGLAGFSKDLKPPEKKKTKNAKK